MKKTTIDDLEAIIIEQGERIEVLEDNTSELLELLKEERRKLREVYDWIDRHGDIHEKIHEYMNK